MGPGNPGYFSVLIVLLGLLSQGPDQAAFPLFLPPVHPSATTLQSKEPTLQLNVLTLWVEEPGNPWKPNL